MSWLCRKAVSWFLFEKWSIVRPWWPSDRKSEKNTAKASIPYSKFEPSFLLYYGCIRFTEDRSSVSRSISSSLASKQPGAGFCLWRIFSSAFLCLLRLSLGRLLYHHIKKRQQKRLSVVTIITIYIEVKRLMQRDCFSLYQAFIYTKPLIHSIYRNDIFRSIDFSATYCLHLAISTTIFIRTTVIKNNYTSKFFTIQVSFSLRFN